MKFLSMFSGIEAASVAFGPLGWNPLAFAEIKKFPSSVLAHHYPDVQNLGDITKVDWAQFAGKTDMVCGGPPCQAFSVAGKGQSLNDSRGRLSLTYVRAIHDIRPRWCLTENVEGWLNKPDNAFGCFLAGLVGADAPLVSGLEGGGWPRAGIATGPVYGAAWRVLDAQYFGVPQRRNRVFVVGYLGDWRRAAKVLFEPQGLSWDTSPGRKARQEAAANARASLEGNGIAPTLRRRFDGLRGDGDDRISSVAAEAIACDIYNGVIDGDVAATVTSRTGVPACSGPRVIVPGEAIGFKNRQDPILYGDQQGPIGAKDNGKAVVYSIMPQNSGKDFKAREVEVTQPLMAGGPVSGNQGGDIVVYDGRGNGDGRTRPTITANAPSHIGDYTPICFTQEETPKVSIACSQAIDSQNGRRMSVSVGLRVRRLTPLECERLQGFPDNYTRIAWRGKKMAECPDGPRYRALGNSWAVPAVRWIGERIAIVDMDLTPPYSAGKERG